MHRKKSQKVMGDEFAVKCCNFSMIRGEKLKFHRKLVKNCRKIAAFHREFTHNFL